MSDTKWADVAHYYTDIPIMSDNGVMIYALGFTLKSHPKPTSAYYQMGGWFPLAECYTPILRHRDDMSEAEARECFKIYDGTEDATLSDVTDVLYFDANQMASTLEVWLGDPPVWHYLLQKGFDLFGLIESGQAIRKEVQNG